MDRYLVAAAALLAALTIGIMVADAGYWLSLEPARLGGEAIESFVAERVDDPRRPAELGYRVAVGVAHGREPATRLPFAVSMARRAVLMLGSKSYNPSVSSAVVSKALVVQSIAELFMYTESPIFETVVTTNELGETTTTLKVIEAGTGTETTTTTTRTLSAGPVKTQVYAEPFIGACVSLLLLAAAAAAALVARRLVDRV